MDQRARAEEIAQGRKGGTIETNGLKQSGGLAKSDFDSTKSMDGGVDIKEGGCHNERGGTGQFLRRGGVLP